MAVKSSKITIKPLAGYVLIESTEATQKTSSGIYLPDTAQEKQGQGKVVATGSSLHIDGREVSCPVKVGDTVFYKKWGGDEIKVENKELKLVKFDDIMAVLE